MVEVYRIHYEPRFVRRGKRALGADYTETAPISLRVLLFWATKCRIYPCCAINVCILFAKSADKIKDYHRLARATADSRFFSVPIFQRVRTEDTSLATEVSYVLIVTKK